MLLLLLTTSTRLWNSVALLGHVTFPFTLNGILRGINPVACRRSLAVVVVVVVVVVKTRTKTRSASTRRRISALEQSCVETVTNVGRVV